jgi:hypothetical protein
MRRLKLVDEIEAAFQSVEYPGDDNIVAGIDEYRMNYDLWLEFKGQHWRNIPPRLVEANRLEVGRFTPKGFCFYLPAYLVAALDPIPYEVDAYLVLNFVPPDDEVQRKKFDEKMNLLTPEQKTVVKKFLRRFYKQNPSLFPEEHKKTAQYWNL